MSQRAKITRLLPHLYHIDDAGESVAYLLCGQTHAMVIDTVNGQEDLHAIVRTLTDLPLIVVNTHGHGDHVAGNLFFEEAWLHPADEELANGFFEEIRNEYGDQAKAILGDREIASCPIKFLSIGQVFDLGGIQLEVVSLRGHTPGSIGLLDRQDRILFSGDGVNTHLWMQLTNCSTLTALRQQHQELKEKHGHQFDFVAHGHDKGLRPAGPVMDQLIRGCDDLLAGRRDNDKPYHYFGGVCWQHPLNDEDENQVIVYTENRI